MWIGINTISLIKLSIEAIVLHFFGRYLIYHALNLEVIEGMLAISFHTHCDSNSFFRQQTPAPI